MNNLQVKFKKDLSIIFSKNLPKYLSKQEIHDILSFAVNPRDYLLISLLWHTGARISEILELRVRDIDFYGKTAKISTLKQKSKGRYSPF